MAIFNLLETVFERNKHKLCFVCLLYMGVLQRGHIPKLCFAMVLTICKDLYIRRTSMRYLLFVKLWFLVVDRWLEFRVGLHAGLHVLDPLTELLIALLVLLPLAVQALCKQKYYNTFTASFIFVSYSHFDNFLSFTLLVFVNIYLRCRKQMYL